MPRSQQLAVASLIALIFLCLAWELWLAPLRPGGSWLVLKTALLLIPLPGIVRGKRYTYRWTSLLTLLYLMEGTVRLTTDHGLSRWLAAGETALALILFASVIRYVREGAAREGRKVKPSPGWE